MAPKPPTLGSAPAKPWRSSTTVYDGLLAAYVFAAVFRSQHVE